MRLRTHHLNRLLLPVLLTLLFTGCARDHTLTVAYLTPGADQAVPAGVNAFFTDHDFAEITVIPLDALTRFDARVIWVDAPDTASWVKFKSRADRLYPALRQAAGRGSSCFFTGYAALLPHDLGWESETPDVRSDKVANDWFFDRKRGLQGLLGHPVFANGLFGGAFLWDTGDSTIAPAVGFFGDNWPREGRVIGVQKRYVFVDEDVKLLLEYNLPGGGKAITLGGWFDLSRDNRLRYRTDQFTANTLHWLAGDSLAVLPTYWAPADTVIALNPATSFDPIQPASLPADALLHSPLAWSQPDPDRSWCSLGGRRTLVMGEERGGLIEAWAFPIRMVKDYRAGVFDGARVYWLDEQPASLLIYPESIVRRYTTPAGSLTETVFSSLAKPGLAVNYRWLGSVQVQLIIQHVCDLRWMWPYDSAALGGLRYAIHPEAGTVAVTAQQGDFITFAGAGIEPAQQFIGRGSSLTFTNGEFRTDDAASAEIAIGRVYSLASGELTYAIAGGNQALEDVAGAYRALLENPAAEHNAAASYDSILLDSMVEFDTPDDEFDRFWKWTLVGIDRFRINTPGLGEALVAGFGTRLRGWDGGQSNNGRPGYAWYFGRDAEWSAFAINDYGDYATVRAQLDFLRRYQGLNGKIFHELSASGVVHYDAADSTPLYIILAADYLRHSGDLDFIRDLYPSLLKAADFLYTTDTDGDGLIENENVGHGWVEGGSLWGSKTTFYLAGLWARTLSDIGYIASSLGETGRARQFMADAADVTVQLDGGFWNDGGQFYNFGKLPDGSFNPEKTILPATVAWFNDLDPAHMSPVLDRYASSEFTTGWGVRILSDRSEHFNPGAYHGGAVWPLFTGWAALAEYKYGHPESGYNHIRENMDIENHGSKGYVEEVLHGAEYKPYGVCPHQCWSETNIAHPAISGMLGFRPDALNRRVRLAPQLPAGWDHLTVRNLRAGDTRFTLQYDRQASGREWRVIHQSGPELQVELDPGHGAAVLFLTAAPEPDSHE